MPSTPGVCDVCGMSVPRGGEPMTVNGWYSGHHYVWEEGAYAGRIRLLRVRCSEHPYDAEAELAAQVTWEDEYQRERMEEGAWSYVSRS